MFQERENLLKSEKTNNQNVIKTSYQKTLKESSVKLKKEQIYLGQLKREFFL